MIVGVLSHRESGHVEKVSAFFIKKHSLRRKVSDVELVALFMSVF